MKAGRMRACRSISAMPAPNGWRWNTPSWSPSSTPALQIEFPHLAATRATIKAASPVSPIGQHDTFASFAIHFDDMAPGTVGVAVNEQRRKIMATQQLNDGMRVDIHDSDVFVGLGLFAAAA